MSRRKEALEGPDGKAHIFLRGNAVRWIAEGTPPIGQDDHGDDIYAEEDYYTLGDEYWIAHDPSGQILRPCDIYFVKRHDDLRRGLEDCAEDVIDAARRYYSDIEIGAVTIDIPDGPWKNLGMFSRIEYMRRGKGRWLLMEGGMKKKGFHHDFKQPVALYKSAGGWRTPLPDGCKVDTHGFVWP